MPESQSIKNTVLWLAGASEGELALQFLVPVLVGSHRGKHITKHGVILYLIQLKDYL